MFSDFKLKYPTIKRLKIIQLRQQLQKCEHLKVGLEDILLTKFLHFTRWDVPNAYEAIQKYYDFKLAHPQCMAQHPVEYFREHFIKACSRYIMPEPDKEGRVILIMKCLDCTNKFPNYMSDIIEMDDLIFESLLLQPRVQKYGITVIIDWNGVTTNFLRTLSASTARLINEKDTIMPFTRRVVHIIQTGFIMSAATSLIMAFLSEDIKNNIYVHEDKNLEKLKEMVGYENLPAEYGGPETNTLNNYILYDYLEKHAKYLQQLQGYKKIISH